jgi:hypothetical protein
MWRSLNPAVGTHRVALLAGVLAAMGVGVASLGSATASDSGALASAAERIYTVSGSLNDAGPPVDDR